MNAVVKKVLIISAKQAVGALVGNSALAAMFPAVFHWHSAAGLIAIGKASLGFIAAAEAKVWIPKILLWVNSPTNGS